MPVPSANRFQPAKVYPLFTSEPEFADAVTVSLVFFRILVGTLPPVFVFPLYVIGNL